VHITNCGEVAERPRRSVRRQRDKAVALIGNQQRAIGKRDTVFRPHQRPVGRKQARVVKCRGACLCSLFWRARITVSRRRAGRDAERGNEQGNTWFHVFFLPEFLDNLRGQ